VSTVGSGWFWAVAVFLVVGFWWLRRARNRAVPTARPLQRTAPAASRARTPDSQAGAPAADDSAAAAATAVAASQAAAATPAAPEPPASLQQFQLLSAADLTPAAAAKVAELSQTLALPHPILAKMAQGLDDDALVDVVVSDPRLSAEVLRTVNSAAFALQSPIESVPRAVAYLGLNYVKGLVSELAVAPAVSLPTPQQHAAARRIWNSSIIASAATQIFATQLSVKAPSVAATQAVLASLGDLCMISADAALAGAYAGGTTLVERVTLQQAASGVNSALVGAALAAQWQLPESVRHSLEQSLVLLVTPPAEHPESGVTLQRAVLCYFAARLGDAVAFGGLRDIALLDADTDAADAPDRFYLPAYFAATQLTRLPLLLQDATIRRKLNQMIAALPR
jgi:HD-like signal output (HDOD) protein